LNLTTLTIDHQLLMKAVKKHTDNRWLLLYIERWLTGPIQLEDGTTVTRKRDVPQGGVISWGLGNGAMTQLCGPRWSQHGLNVVSERKTPTSIS
jgi:hypothetical protein